MAAKAREAIGARRTRMIIAVVLLSGPAGCGDSGKAVSGDAILITSFGPSETLAPNIVPEIALINIDGTGRKALLPPRTLSFDPALSADGKKIAFVGPADEVPTVPVGSLGLFVMNADGSERKRIARGTEPGEHLLGPSWSPDGRQIAFTRFVFGFRGNGTVFASTPQIELIDAGGGNPKRLGKANGFNPVWSFDGTRLLFEGSGEEEGASGLCVIDRDGSNRRQLVKPPAEGTLSISGAWSPDGRSLAYAVASENGGLYLAKADGLQPRRLVGGPRDIVFGVRWSADGNRLLFTRWLRPEPAQDDPDMRRAASKVAANDAPNVDGPINAVALSPDGKRALTQSGVTRLWDTGSGKAIRTLGASPDLFSMIFSPDGRSIIFTGGHGSMQLWDAETGKLVRESRATSVAFSPDGKQVVSNDHFQTALLWDALGQGDPQFRRPARGDFSGSLWSGRPARAHLG